MATNSYKALQRIIQSRGVRDVCDEVADRIARNARSLARIEGLPNDIITTEGTRPKGRPYARVAIPAREEFGDAKTTRKRILSRAVRLL